MIDDRTKRMGRRCMIRAARARVYAADPASAPGRIRRWLHHARVEAPAAPQTAVEPVYGLPSTEPGGRAIEDADAARGL